MRYKLRFLTFVTVALFAVTMLQSCENCDDDDNYAEQEKQLQEDQVQ